MNEIFKDVEGFEGLYQISNLGRVKSLNRTVISSNGKVRNLKEKIMKPCLIGTGYVTVVLYTGKKTIKLKHIHRLIALHFIPNPDNKPQVNHINSIRNDNRLVNLEWVTPRENSSHGYKRKNKTSKYTGVSWHKSDNAWTACIRINKKVKHLGSFKNQEDAHQAYLDALKKYGLKNKYA